MAGNTRITNASFQAIVQLGAAHTQRTVAGTAVALKDHTVSTSTTHVLVQFNNADIRVTFDGTTPTTSQKPTRSLIFKSRELSKKNRPKPNSNGNISIK